MAQFSRSRQAEDRSEALDSIGETLDALEAERRSPDPWERFYLMHALQAFFSGLYGFATVQARMAALPHAARAAESGAPFGPVLMDCDLPVLRRAYNEAVKAELIPVPHLGPVPLVQHTMQ